MKDTDNLFIYLCSFILFLNSRKFFIFASSAQKKSKNSKVQVRERNAPAAWLSQLQEMLPGPGRLWEGAALNQPLSLPSHSTETLKREGTPSGKGPRNGLH